MNIDEKILELLKKNTIGLSINEISEMLGLNRATVSKYLFMLSVRGDVFVREIGKAKLHYLKKTYERMMKK